MEKKNINIGVVRTCTILLLTVFTIGRKYGQGENAENLINSLQQQPCTCCLNFENVAEVAKKIDEAKEQLETAKTKLETANKILEENIKVKEDYNNQLQNEKEILVEEKNKFNYLLNEQNDKLAKLNKDFYNLKGDYTKINNENEKNVEFLEKYRQNFKQVNKERNDLKDILKNTKTNVNTEEYVKFYNSISAEKKIKIDIFLNDDLKNLKTKEYTFYIPFRFKDCGKHLKKNRISDALKNETGYYENPHSLYNILRSLFERYGLEKFKKEKIIDVATLKEIYFYSNFCYDREIMIDKDNKFVENNAILNIIEPANCFYNTSGNNKNKITSYYNVAKGITYKDEKKSIQLNYSELIELVNIDEYLEKKEKHKDDEDPVALAGLEDLDEDLVKNMVIDEDDKELFLLKLDFKDPECIALLESVGKGNYGVVKKGLTIENGELVTKAIKFTCSNNLFPNSSKENILKEIRAGKIVNEIGVGNKIAFVKDYMKIKEFKKRYEYNEKEKEEEKKIVPCGKETEDGNLTNAVYTTFLNNNLEALPEKKKNVKANFENNVFNKEGKIGEYLYIMFMDIVNGTDLFLNEEKKEIDINILGKMLFDVLNNLCASGVALKDIKPKNIMWDDKKKNFSIIDVQTLGKVGKNLTDSCGTPELWPFFKTLNLDLESNNEKENIDKKNDLYDRFCYSIDDNFVDIYAACMTMYFTKFSTYTAAGLLTLLLKWIVLDKEEKFSIKDKIEFLKDYENKYTSYIKDIKNNKKNDKEILKNEIKNPIEDKKDPNEDKKLINYFFEKIDDKNLNDDQKKNLANLLKQVITLGDKSNIFYLLEETKNFVKKYENKYNLNNDIENIINFYKLCVEKDFNNFAKLSKDNCKYADVIKYVLCYGSCLNYIGDNKGEMNVDNILEQLVLKNKIEFNDKEFFDTTKNKVNNIIKDVIEKLNNGFNQTFIIELLNILPLGEYEEILKYGVSNNSVNYYFEKKMKDTQNPIKEEEIDPKTKAFYLLRYLEINKLFHIPKRLVKINSLINENTDDEFKENLI